MISWNLYNEHPKTVECHPMSTNGIDLVLAISPDKFSHALLEAHYRHLKLLFYEYSEDWATEETKLFSPFMKYLTAIN